MKIWIKYAVGIIIGLILGLYLPMENENIKELFSFLARLIINMGMFALYPLVFFSFGYGIHKLRLERSLLPTMLKTLAAMAVSGLLLVIIGTLTVTLFSPGRIPIIIEKKVIENFPSLKSILDSLFPANTFKMLTEGKNYLLPVIFLAFAIGINFSFDKVMTRPGYQFFNAMSRIFYHMTIFITEIMGLGMIILSANLLLIIRSTPEIQLFKQLLSILTLNAVVITFGIYPLIFYFLSGKQNPYKILYALTAPLLASFLSGNSYFSYLTTVRSGKENLGIPRKTGAVVFPLFTLFGKAGTAMVSATAFILILNSYSSMGISVGKIIWIMIFSFITSFFTGSVPGIGVIVALSYLCSLYGKGIEEGFLLIYPVSGLLIRFSTFLDTLTAGYSAALISIKERDHKEIMLKDFI